MTRERAGSEHTRHWLCGRLADIGSNNGQQAVKAVGSRRGWSLMRTLQPDPLQPLRAKKSTDSEQGTGATLGAFVAQQGKGQGKGQGSGQRAPEAAVRGL